MRWEVLVIDGPDAILFCGEETEASVNQNLALKISSVAAHWQPTTDYWGQAVAWWANRFRAQIESDLRDIGSLTSRDLDLWGGRDDLGEIAWRCEQVKETGEKNSNNKKQVNRVYRYSS